MMRRTTYVAALLLCLALIGGNAASRTDAPRRDESLVAQLIAQASTDPELDPYPNFRAHVLTILRRKAAETRPLALNAYASTLLGGAGQPSVEMRREDVFEFFEACARDRLTILRAMGFVARVVRQTGVIVYLNGAHARAALTTQRLDVGLALPMRKLRLFAYLPPKPEDGDDVQSRFVAVYEAPYEHRFSKDVLDATLRIGTGRTVTYLDPWDPEAEITTAYLVTGKIIYGKAGIGFVDVEGVGGRKHGVLGALQRVFFFLPDAIDAMVLRDGSLYVKAIVDQKVTHFETTPQYAVHYREGAFLNRPLRR